MLKAASLSLALSLISLTATASVTCNPVLKKDATPLRGVQVAIHGTVVDTVWFGTNVEARNRAHADCEAVLSASYCSEETPLIKDQYRTEADGFTVRTIKWSSKAGRLHLSDVPSHVLAHVPAGYSKHNNEYFTFFESCHNQRADLAVSVLESHEDQYRASTRSGFEHFTPIHISEKL